MKHKTLWIVIVWLVFLIGALALQAVLPNVLPLAEIVNLVGVISLSYVGIDKAKNIVLAAKAPAGEFGADYITPIADKNLWIVIVWLFILIETLSVQAIVTWLMPDGGLTIPITDVVTYSGILSATYVGLDKGTKIAAVTGKEGAT
jgi:hypothetical protein